VTQHFRQQRHDVLPLLVGQILNSRTYDLLNRMASGVREGPASARDIRIAAPIKKGAANGTFLYNKQLLLKLRSGDADRP
jgi:hypothetical protein